MLALPLSDPAGPIGLFIGSFLASTLLPGGSEAMLLLAVQQQMASPSSLWLLATTGNTLGGLSSWLLGWWLAWRFPGRGLQKPEQHRALTRISRHGAPLLLLSWLPLVGDPLCVAAGWSGIHWLPATLYIAAGKALRYALLLGLFTRLG